MLSDWTKLGHVTSPEKETWKHVPTGIQVVLWEGRDTWDLYLPGADDACVCGLSTLRVAVQYVEDHKVELVPNL